MYHWQARTPAVDEDVDPPAKSSYIPQALYAYMSYLIGIL